jgi:hypothetical protein
MITEQINGITHSTGQGLAKMSDVEYFQHNFIRSIVQNADEVWVYNPQNRSFECVKNRRSGNATTLMSFLVSRGIHIRPDAAALANGKPPMFRFVDEKDHFLFQLKF